MKFFFYILIFIVSIQFFSCKKNNFNTSSDAALIISSDTLRFDTVFTTTGSVTKYFTINNPNNKKINLSSVQLMGGNASAFRMNVDGVAGNSFNNITIEANDSVYIFITVSINPNSNTLPFIVNDSIRIQWNGNTIFKQLEAWGQNAIFLRSTVIKGNNTWNSTLPYVIIGGIRIDTTASLTIQKGTRVYMHADAPFVVDGTLKINGTKTDSVVFRGDRLDESYRDLPAAWPGIYFRSPSKNSELTFTVIKNAYQAVVVEGPSVNANPKLVLAQCIIDNAYESGLYFLRSNVIVQNSLISNCGKNIIIGYGGSYVFTHCTSAAFSTNFINHKNPVLFAGNSIRVNNVTSSADLNATFTNCIFWGDNGTVEDEIVTSKEGSSAFSVNFNNVLYKVKSADPANANFLNSIKNSPPLFDSIDAGNRYFNFRLKQNSPAINKGIATSLTIDLDGKPRAIGLPDLGCYEKQ